jgi:hypothetical protein
MKKKFLLLLPLVFLMSLCISAQTKPKVTKSSGTAMSADKVKMLCKPWKLDSTEEYGTANPKSSKQANDVITFISDGNLFMVMNGLTNTGTWKSGNSSYINIAVDKSDIKMFKLISIADSRLVLEYQLPAPDLSKIKYIYHPKK